MSLFTEKAAETAMRNGIRDFDKYIVEETIVKGMFEVTKKADPNCVYTVFVDNNGIAFKCDCEFHTHEHTCKHEYIVVETLRIDAMGQMVAEAEDLYPKL